MTTSPTAATFLYSIDECPDLMADACICDESNHLIFLSIWGRDTSIQQFLARLELRSSEKGGLDRFHLVTADHSSIAVAVPEIDRLEKRTTRSFTRTLFGSVIHTWLFESQCVRPDKANASALAILPKDDLSRTQRLWSLVQDTCPLPLLPHWRDSVLELLQSQHMLVSLPFSLGKVEGFRIALDVPTLTVALGDLIRSGALNIVTSEQETTDFTWAAAS